MSWKALQYYYPHPSTADNLAQNVTKSLVKILLASERNVSGSNVCTQGLKTLTSAYFSLVKPVTYFRTTVDLAG